MREKRDESPFLEESLRRTSLAQSRANGLAKEIHLYVLRRKRAQLHREVDVLGEALPDRTEARGSSRRLDPGGGGTGGGGGVTRGGTGAEVPARLWSSIH